MVAVNWCIFRKNQVTEKMILMPLLVFHLVQAFDTAKGFVNLITKQNSRISFTFMTFLLSNELR